MDEIIDNALFTEGNLVRLLSINDSGGMEYLCQKAYEIKTKYVGKTVYLRGLIELSNICRKNCYYCGIRKDNHAVNRYIMTKDEIIEAARLSWQLGYGSIVLQAGEVVSDTYADFIADVVKSIKQIANGGVGITLSLGEQTKEVYKLWRKAGAHRYLLRIETSDPEFYKCLHPDDHSFDIRLACLNDLKEAGYIVGTGVMIGLPDQTLERLARDILFFRRIDADMIGMGPYIPHPATPLAVKTNGFADSRDERLNLSLRMIAVVRAVLKDVNIVSTTALQSINTTGCEVGLLAGANIIMPNVTDFKYKKDYILYENKPCIGEDAVLSKDRLEPRVRSIGEQIGYYKTGDPPHFIRRNG
ncbi:MAG: [FeFe] hydrogenase H-cluster radical SAM maturase HydE [Deltaproteobacteria bacterium]|nr:[FeFe] hydrogenase H-cluster radical SAM maturase HydE [Deltaproteobacteria bacterium]